MKVMVLLKEGISIGTALGFLRAHDDGIMIFRIEMNINILCK